MLRVFKKANCSAYVVQKKQNTTQYFAELGKKSLITAYGFANKGKVQKLKKMLLYCLSNRRAPSLKFRRQADYENRTACPA